MQLFGRPQWLTVKGRSETYVSKVGTGLFLVPILCISCCLCMCPGEWVIKLTQLFWRWDGMVLTFKTDASLVADYCRSESSRLTNSDWNCCYSHHHYISRYVTCNLNGSSLFVVQEYGFWKPNCFGNQRFVSNLKCWDLRAFETFGGRTQETMVFSHATIMYPAMSRMQQLKRLSSLSDQCKNSVRVYTQHSAHMVSCERCLSVLTTLLWSELQ
jgi:hypothetical protein